MDDYIVAATVVPTFHAVDVLQGDPVDAKTTDARLEVSPFGKRKRATVTVVPGAPMSSTSAVLDW